MTDAASLATQPPGPAEKPAGAKSRGFIVDDHTMFREGMKQLIDRELDLAVCGDAADIAEALRSIPELKPDLSTATINTFRNRIKEKLDFKNSAEMVLNAIQWTRGDR